MPNKAKKSVQKKRQQFFSVALSILGGIFSYLLPELLERIGLMENIPDSWIQYAFAFVVSAIIWCLLNMFWIKKEEVKLKDSPQLQNTIKNKKMGLIGFAIIIGLIIANYAFNRGKGNEKTTKKNNAS